MKAKREPDAGDASLGRRDFLRQAAALGAGLAAAGWTARAKAGKAEGQPAPKTEIRNAQPDILYRRLGRTNFMVSALTFGAIQLSSDSLNVFDAAINNGVNLAHTCGGYNGGKSIRAIGQWLKTPGNRERIFLALKAGPGNIDQELKILGTDCVDLLMVPIHNPEPVLNEDRPRQFDALRKAGKARHMGMTFHANLPAVWKNGVKADWFDLFQPTYNTSSRPQLKPLLKDSKKKDIGVLTMKSLGGMPRGEDAVAVWKTFLDDGVDAILRTITSVEQLKDYLRVTLKSDTTSARLHPSACAGQCTLCGACDACPQGVAIQDTLRTYQYYARQLGWMDEARTQYAEIPLGAQAMACADCGRCEAVCPQNLAVRALVREAHAALA